jgi:hypothetical protein
MRAAIARLLHRLLWLRVGVAPEPEVSRRMNKGHALPLDRVVALS